MRSSGPSPSGEGWVGVTLPEPNMFIDARIPVRFAALDTRIADEAVLTDAHDPAPPPALCFEPDPANAAHPIDCACCQPRSAAGSALATLFRDRALATGPAFKGVLAVVSPTGEAAIRAALETDPLVSARFRLA